MADEELTLGIYVQSYHRYNKILTQNLLERCTYVVRASEADLYRKAGVTYIDVYTAYSTDASYIPEESDYHLKNIPATSRQKVLIDEKRIEVVFHADADS